MTAPLSIEQLLAAHPWPEEHAKTPRLEWLWHFEVDLPVAQLWPIIADSSRMNRALHVQEMKFEERGNERWGTSRPGGFEHEWREVPWNWVAGQWLESVRLYKKGFSKVVYGVFVLTPLAEERTRVSVYFGAIPRNLLGKLALNFGFPTLEKDFKRVFAEVTAQLKALKPIFEIPPPTLSPEQTERLNGIREKMRTHSLDQALVDRLFEWVRTADDLDLFRIQVRERARAWRVDELELLRVALHATRDGLLEISWDLICPHCRGPASKFEELGELSSNGRCEVCEIDFGSNTPESVEITFHVHPAVRPIERRTYCSAEPSTKQHIRLQYELGPGKSLEVGPSLEAGRWRLRTHGRKDYGLLDTDAAQPAAPVEWKASTPPTLRAPVRPSLRLVNDAPEPRRFIVEAAGWNDFALRPAQLFNVQEYRDLFSEDYLGADVQLAIGEQTILFTDIVGSTAMYATRGDPAAFMEVKKHFNEIFPLIAKHHGAVVKTIGDAIMASFTDPLDAVKASADIHACFHKDRADSATRLRISLNTGPCIAVKLNAGIDYFGQTVNLSAKLQSLAEAGEVALSHAVFNARGVKDFLAGRALEDCAYESKALPAPVPVKRWKTFA
ncbi:MAG: adenylate/guanylate cyclase domain-containing protein [Myxococcaceae bacterium]